MLLEISTCVGSYNWNKETEFLPQNLIFESLYISMQTNIVDLRYFKL